MAVPPSLTPLPVPVYFLSDAHLGAVLVPDARRQRENLDRFLDLVQQDGRTLVLVGDLFDFWFEWKYVIPKDQFHFLHRLRTLVDHGISIHFLAGNHDFRLHGFLEKEIGIRIHPDGIAADIASQPTYIFHGDGVLARDTGYRLLKRVLRSRTAQRIFSWFHPDFAMRLARGTSVTSRTMLKPDPSEDAEYLAFAQGQFAAGYRGVVMGHTHRPVEHFEDGHVYVNTGDWITHYTYGLHDGERLRLQHFINS